MLDSLCRDVILDLQGHAIIGNGTGIGMLILKSGHDTTVKGSDSSETGQAIINGRGPDSKTTATNVAIELFRQIGGTSLISRATPAMQLSRRTPGGSQSPTSMRASMAEQA